MPRLQLTEQEATIIHNIILNHGDTELVDAYTESLQERAAFRIDGGFETHEWRATELPDNIIEILTDTFGYTYLEERNLVRIYSEEVGFHAKIGKEHIELRVLTDALPDEVVRPYYKPDGPHSSFSQGPCFS